MKKYSKALRQALTDARFVVLERRYDSEYIFSVVFDTTPDAVNSDGSYLANRMIGGGRMSYKYARFLLDTLYPDTSRYEFATLDEQTRDYITHNIAPLEWHEGLDAMEPLLMDRLVIYGYDRPCLPDDLEAKDDAFYSITTTGIDVKEIYAPKD